MNYFADPQHNSHLFEQQAELILQSTGEGIYGLNCQGFTTFVNRAAEEMVGWTKAEMIGKSQHDLIHHTTPDGQPYDSTLCPIYLTFKDGQVHHVDNERFWRKDGSSFEVAYVSTPIKCPNGTLLGAVICFKDITSRKNNERALQQANRDLRAALRQVEALKLQLQQENAYLQSELKIQHNFEEIISCSEKFKEVLHKVEQVAPTDATVLITGESGTGKELIARAIHHLSPRKQKPLVKVNCAALPANLTESELFGHERGAFTSAISQKTGRFELADGGTIFLDEIGELPIELQSKLLRVLQEGEFERIGGTQTKRVNVRVIAATNRNLQDEINAGRFRLDLYYRLNVFPILVHPLRQRLDDIPLLAQYFMHKFSHKFGKPVSVISQKVMAALCAYSWPGNVRELENVIERSVIISADHKLDLGDPLHTNLNHPGNEEWVTLAENERRHILAVLEHTHWRVSGPHGAAKILGMKRTTLEARMAKLDIQRPM